MLIQITPFHLDAQEEIQKEYSKIALNVGYFGEFILHPGIYGGIDYTLSSKLWLNIHWNSEIGCYYHKWNNNALFLQSSIGTRFTTSFSFFADVNLGVGYILSSPNGEVYKVNDQGELTEKGRTYTSHAKPSVSLTLGWDGKRKKDIPFTAGLGVEGYWQTGFNHIALPHAALKLGITYQLKSKQ